MTRYRNAPPMGLRPAKHVEPRSVDYGHSKMSPEMGVMGCAPIISALVAFAVFAALAALIVFGMALG